MGSHHQQRKPSWCWISWHYTKITDHNLWWNGPSWLKEDPSNWHLKISAPPSLETLYSSGIDEASLQLKERKEVTLQSTTTPNETKPVIDIERYSNYSHLLRVTAWEWVFRVVTRSHLFSATPLSLSCLEPKLGCSNKHKPRCYQKQWKHFGRGNHSLCPILYNR